MTPTPPAFELGLFAPLERSDLSGAAAELLPLLRSRSDALIRLSEPRVQRRLRKLALLQPLLSPARLARLGRPGCGEWLVLAALPLNPPPRASASIPTQYPLDDGSTAYAILVRHLAWLTQGVEEYERPTRLIGLRRGVRAVGWLARGISKRLGARRSRYPYAL
jgi:hypothetical protein